MTKNKVKDLFSSLNEDKSSLGIPIKLIKIAAEPLAVPFTSIYNESIKTGIVPDIFKLSRVTPIYKSGEQTDPNNYRPISTLSPFTKVFEKIIYAQLNSFCTKNSILYKYQFGFRKGHSTEQAILEITDHIKANIENKLITCGLFLDFSKAFDTVNHDILIEKLNKYGIRGIAQQWFSSYLNNRKQFVTMNGIDSSPLLVKCGVPQGSTLGPLLFLLYINDMPNASSKLLFRIFADDTNIFFAADNEKLVESTMNEELKLVYRYCAVNKLSINMKKTNYMIISNKKLKPTVHIKDIEYKSIIKYLGIYLDDKLNWNMQIKHVNNKIAKNIGIIYKLRNYFKLRMLRQLYYNLIFPYITYGLLSWGNTYKSKLTKIYTKQNKAIRTIFFAKSRENADIYYNILDILNLENVFKLKSACLIYRICNSPSDLPEAFSNYVVQASHKHQYNTRFASQNNLYRPKIRTNFGKHTFRYSASIIWETIPLNIKQSNSISSFKKIYKNYLLYNR